MQDLIMTTTSLAYGSTTSNVSISGGVVTKISADGSFSQLDLNLIKRIQAAKGLNAPQHPLHLNISQSPNVEGKYLTNKRTGRQWKIASATCEWHAGYVWALLLVNPESSEVLKVFAKNISSAIPEILASVMEFKNEFGDLYI